MAGSSTKPLVGTISAIDELMLWILLFLLKALGLCNRAALLVKQLASQI